MSFATKIHEFRGNCYLQPWKCGHPSARPRTVVRAVTVVKAEWSDTRLLLLARVVRRIEVDQLRVQIEFHSMRGHCGFFLSADARAWKEILVVFLGE